MKTNSSALRLARINAGLTQPELADRSGVTQGQISILERLPGTGRAETLAKLAKALDCSIEDIL